VRDIHELDTVRVIAVRRSSSSSGCLMGSPKLGDLGTVVDIRTEGGESVYTVEKVSEVGCTEWLADFVREEIEWTASPG
jgi:hypothetical protein